MRIGDIEIEDEVFVIAEIGKNHEGDVKQAESMIEAAAGAGAHAVKFQTFNTDLYLSPKLDEKGYQRLKSFELTQDEFKRLKEVADENGVIFFSSPFELPSVDFLDTIAPLFKIASADNNFYPLIEKVAKTGKPIIMSTGLVDIEQVKKTYDFIQDIWKKHGINQDIVVLQCVCDYPVPIERANVGAIKTLQDSLDCRIGYSDHTLGIDACVLATSLGACVIEKHFTLDKNFSEFRDHQLSATPDELKSMIDKIRQNQILFGKQEKTIQDCERQNLDLTRRSIAFKHRLPKDHQITDDDIMWIRPSSGEFHPGDESQVVGKTLTKDVEQAELASSDQIQ